MKKNKIYMCDFHSDDSFLTIPYFAFSSYESAYEYTVEIINNKSYTILDEYDEWGSHYWEVQEPEMREIFTIAVHTLTVD